MNDAQRKAYYGKKYDPVMERHKEIQRLLAKTSGKMGMTHKEAKELELKAKGKKK